MKLGNKFTLSSNIITNTFENNSAMKQFISPKLVEDLLCSEHTDIFSYLILVNISNCKNFSNILNLSLG